MLSIGNITAASYVCTSSVKFLVHFTMGVLVVARLRVRTRFEQAL